MKATDLAQIIYSMDSRLFYDQYTIYHPYENTTAKQAFSEIFEDKPVQSGYYLWIWAESDDEYKEIKDILKLTPSVEPFLEHQTDELHHIIIKIED